MSLYSPDTDPKYQTDDAPSADDIEAGVIISADTRRENRLPKGQHRTRKWPVLHASHVPEIDSATWRLTVDGLVDHELSFSLEEFRKLPRSKVFADFHCVTAWSRLGNLWEGVLVRDLLKLLQPTSGAGFVVIAGADNNWTTNLPLEHFLADDVILTDTHDGVPLDADHGGPVRLIVPRLFAWKSAKWINRITFVEHNQPGFWEQAGYHNVGDPWLDQRYRDDTEWLQQQAAKSDQ